MKKGYRTIDLFAGIGGIRIGFERAGFKTLFANDFDPKCKETYDVNFKDAPLIIEDIRNIDSQELPSFDFLLGGFPCQAFSIAGYRQGFLDKKGRGNLFLEIARIIRDKSPIGFMLENVKNLQTHDGGRTIDVIIQTLKSLDYDMKIKVLNTMEYGNLPQNRERVYMVGFKKNTGLIDKFEFPEPIIRTVSISNILEDPNKIDSRFYYKNKPLYEKLKKSEFRPGIVYQWRRQYVRENKSGVCPTLTANMGTGGHNVPLIIDRRGLRKLTPRECARLQGFPDTYLLPNMADSHLYKQLGNSVSIPVIERIAKEILKAFEGKTQKVKQPALKLAFA